MKLFLGNFSKRVFQYILSDIAGEISGGGIRGGGSFYLKVESICWLVKRVGESAFVRGGLCLKYLKMSSTFM